MKPSVFSVLGVMSGTSLDGVDFVLARFTYSTQWSFQIHGTETIPYPTRWIEKLNSAVSLAPKELAQLDEEYTLHLGNLITDYLAKNRAFTVDIVSSHGHTVKHNPAAGLTYQIGNLPLLSKQCNQTVVCDFRVADVALGGQGAPLVPGGEVHLFSDFAACVNLGGFANITHLISTPVFAYDIGAVNTILNYLMIKLGKAFDYNGELARSGKPIPSFLEALNQLDFYTKKGPKSLGIEWVHLYLLPVLKEFDTHSIPDLLHSYCLHIGQQIGKELPKKGKVLFTGGGTHNLFLMELIRKHTSCDITVPEQELIDFKEALVFAFLGVLKTLDQPNCLSSVTGAINNHSSGNIFLPND